MTHSHDHGLHEHSHDHSHDELLDRRRPNSESLLKSTDEEPVPTGDVQESHHQATVVATFDSYLRSSLSANQRRRADFWALPEEQRQLLLDHAEMLKLIDSKLRLNAEFVEAAVQHNVFPPTGDASLSAPAPKEADHERLRSTLRQCARDWSSVGQRERDATYTPILDALKSHFRYLPSTHWGNVRVLVPGAGLGRLAWEIVHAGFSCQANEFSLFMLIVSAFILNNTTQTNEFELYPNLHSLSNRRNRADLFSPVFVPDVLPSDVNASGGDFSFAAGDFLEVYAGDDDSWDAIVTCFFIDTARNIVDYLQLIYRLLRSGGVWINCGPTLWHFENSSDGSSSIELTLEDVQNLARRIGFIITEEREIKTSYTTNPLSMLQHQYTASFWVATKP